MKTIKYIFLSVVLLGFTACSEDDYDYNPEPEPLPALTMGSIDITNYVAVGASFSAGFADGAVFIAGQENSFPNILSQQFGIDNFTQPLMNDNIGGFVAGGNPILHPITGDDLFPPRFYLDLSGASPAPTRLDATPTTDLALTSITGPFNNMGVPGAKSFHITLNGYGGLNPYFGRMASSSTASVLEDALAQNPTFFTLSEIGGNDVLSYATSGGTGVDQTGNFDPSTYGGTDITDPNVFAGVFSAQVDALTANDAKGVLANVPYVTNLPFFTTVPNNALNIDAGTAASLTGFFQAVAGITTQGLILQGVPAAQAQALAAQYAITFNEGPNRFLIDVPMSATNPLGFRQMTEDELLLLTINQTALAQGYGSVVLTPEVLQVLGLLQTGGTPTPQQAGLVLAAVSGIDDGDALDSSELLSIKNATDAYNTTIAAVASSKDLGIVDFKGILEEASTTGISDGDFTLTTSFISGGLVSMDGIHLTARGYAVMANKFLEAIDTTYGSNFIAAGVKADPGNYPTVYSQTLQ